jgi:hypothetical protein
MISMGGASTWVELFSLIREELSSEGDQRAERNALPVQRAAAHYLDHAQRGTGCACQGENGLAALGCKANPAPFIPAKAGGFRRVLGEVLGEAKTAFPMFSDT